MWGLGSALSLQLQEALISVYVVLFGGLMVAFAVGASHEGLRLWFGFLHTPHGQLGFLLVAGNLTCGLRPNPNPNPNPTPNPYPDQVITVEGISVGKLGRTRYPLAG